MKIDWKKTTDNFKGRLCAGGIDLSAVSDLTCWVMAFPDDNDKEYADFLMRTWCPQERLHDKQNKYRDQYQAWETEGYLEATEGNAIDYDYVREQVYKDAQAFKIDSIGVDRLFQGYEFCMKLDKKLGGTEKDPKVVACGMGYYSMGGLCQEFERRLINHKLNHGGNPIMRFAADNVSVSMDPAGNLKPNKSTSQGKIDPIIGILLALDRLMRLKPKISIKMPGLV